MEAAKTLTLKEAATVTGTTKPTILKAINKDRVQANKNHKGEWVVNIASLSQSYNFVPNFEELLETGKHKLNANPETGVNTKVNTQNESEIIELQVQTKLLQERINDKDEMIQTLKQDKDGLQRQIESFTETITKQTMLITSQMESTHTQKLPDKQGAALWEYALILALLIALIVSFLRFI
jgi:S-adenosylmethionine synthetase